MTRFDWLTILLSGVGVLVLPALALMIRLTVRWTRTEDRLNVLIRDVGKLVEDKDRVHTEMLQSMREDRSVTDRRLRWLEENLWNARTGRNSR